MYIAAPPAGGRNRGRPAHPGAEDIEKEILQERKLILMMKKWKEKAASKAGFTLVELIVVIAVLAILAAVAVPTYSGYVKKANNAKVLSELTTVVTAAASAAAESGASVSEIEVASDGKITVTTSDSTIDATMPAKMAVYAENIDSGSMKNWTNVTKNSEYASKTLTWTASGQTWTAS